MHNGFPPLIIIEVVNYLVIRFPVIRWKVPEETRGGAEVLGKDEVVVGVVLYKYLFQSVRQLDSSVKGDYNAVSRVR